MKIASLGAPEVALIALTRVILGVGIGLLIHDKLQRDQQQVIGWTCLVAGVLTTIPLIANILVSGLRNFQGAL